MRQIGIASLITAGVSILSTISLAQAKLPSTPAREVTEEYFGTKVGAFARRLRRRARFGLNSLAARSRVCRRSVVLALAGWYRRVPTSELAIALREISSGILYKRADCLS